MKTYRFELAAGAVMALLLALFCLWQQPARPLTQAEVDAYMARIDDQLPWPADEKRATLEHVRAWAMADDGRPVHMLNLMRFHPQMRPMAQLQGYHGTPQQANAYYEENVMPLLFARGGYPVFGGGLQGVPYAQRPNTNLVSFDPAVDDWSRVLVVRYPSRRAFLELLSDPVYAKYFPYKSASLMLALAPMAAELVLPDLRLALGALLLAAWLALGWWRAARRHMANRTARPAIATRSAA